MIPFDLRGPVDVELAGAVDAIPGPNALPGGTVWEPKWDGYRGVIVRSNDREPPAKKGRPPAERARPAGSIGSTRIWSRNHRDLSDWFPDDVSAAAAAQLPPGTVVDGELVILVDGRLSFDALQRRLATTPAKAQRLVA